MLDKYIKVNDRQIICGQTSTGIWYCKELPSNNTGELNTLIGEVNNILNGYNNNGNGKKEKKTIKSG